MPTARSRKPDEIIRASKKSQIAAKKKKEKEADAANKFVAVVERYDAPSRFLHVRVRDPFLLAKPYIATIVAELQHELKAARTSGNAAERGELARKLLLEIVGWQQALNERKSKGDRMVIDVPEQAMIRAVAPPEFLDENGNPRPATSRELRELRKPKEKLPGFPAHRAQIVPNQMIEIQAQWPADAAALEKKRAAQPRPGVDPPKLHAVMLTLGPMAPTR